MEQHVEDAVKSRKAKEEKTEVIGQCPAPRLISKHRLQVDKRYQRGLTPVNIAAMRKQWFWGAVSCLSVSERVDETLWVFDGQQRLTAALQRGDIDALPCMVHKFDGIEDEAMAFVMIQKNRTTLTQVDTHEALVIAGNAEALLVEQFVVASGRRISRGTSPACVACAQVLRKTAGSNAARFRRVWPLVAELCHGHQIKQDIYLAVWFLECKCEESLSDQRWRSRLMRIGYDEVMAAIDKSVKYHDSGRSRSSCAIGLANALNKGLKPGRLLQHTIMPKDKETDEAFAEE